MTGNSTFTNASGATFAVNSGSYTSSGLVTNNGTTTVSSGATLTGNAGINNSNSLTSSGTVAGGLTNTGTVNANGGAMNGVICNNGGGQFNVGGVVTGNNAFTNASGATSRSIPATTPRPGSSPTTARRRSQAARR